MNALVSKLKKKKDVKGNFLMVETKIIEFSIIFTIYLDLTASLNACFWRLAVSREQNSVVHK